MKLCKNLNGRTNVEICCGSKIQGAITNVTYKGERKVGKCLRVLALLLGAVSSRRYKRRCHLYCVYFHGSLLVLPPAGHRLWSDAQRSRYWRRRRAYRYDTDDQQGRLRLGHTDRDTRLIYMSLSPVTCLTVRLRSPPNPQPFVLRQYLNGFRDPAYAFIVIGSFMFYWGMFLPLNYILLQAKAQGMSPQVVPYLLPISNAFR